MACRLAANGLNINIPTMHVDMAWIDVQDAGSIPAASTKLKPCIYGLNHHEYRAFLLLGTATEYYKIPPKYTRTFNHTLTNHFKTFELGSDRVKLLI